MCGHGCVTAAADLISPFVITVIDWVVEQLWGGRLSRYRLRLQDVWSEMLAVNLPDMTQTQDSLYDPVFRSFHTFSSVL